jgi:HEAT repeat protein
MQFMKASDRQSKTHRSRLLASLVLAMSLTPSLSASIQDNSLNRSLTPIQLEIEKQKQRLRSSDMEDRRDALMRLGRLRRAEASRVAVPALSDPLPIIRATAASALRALPADESATALIPLLSDKDEFVRQQAAYALGHVRNGASALALVERLKTDKLDSVRAAAAVALGEVGDESAVVALTEVLAAPGSGSKKRKGEKNEFILRAAARSLGEIGSRAGVPALMETLTNENVPGDVKREAARSLGVIGDPAAIPALQAAQGASDPYLAQIAVEALRKIGARRPA